MNQHDRATTVATAFLEQTDVAEPEILFRSYSRYLIKATDQTTLPVSLDEIREYCGLHRRDHPLDRRGFLFGNSIIINSDDPITVQRFTEAHEVMESFNTALQRESPSRFSQNVRREFPLKKELWCENGAANLLMPTTLFYPLVTKFGVSLTTARRLSTNCRTSLTATVRQMLSADTELCFFVLFKVGHKKSEYVPSNVGQGVLWGKPDDWDPPAELRVWRRWSSPQTNVFLCINESVQRNTKIYQTLHLDYSDGIQYGHDTLELEKFQGKFHTESILVTIEGEPVVMSLIHL